MTSQAITVPEAARRLGVAERTVWRRILDGTIPRVSGIGRVARVSEQVIDEMINPKQLAQSKALHPSAKSNVVSLASAGKRKGVRTFAS